MMESTPLDWLLAKTVRAMKVDTHGQSDLHALAVEALYAAAVDDEPSGIMLPDGTTPRFTGRAVKERPMCNLSYRPDVTAEVVGHGWLVFEVCVSNGKDSAYHKALAEAGIRGVELFVYPHEVCKHIEASRDAVLIPKLVIGALRRALLTGTKGNRRWIGKTPVYESESFDLA